eukprot:m51a1_g2029 putative myeloid lymphoid or mixed-lineage leukemia (592) ;mRNA; f:1311518-1314227
MTTVDLQLLSHLVSHDDNPELQKRMADLQSQYRHHLNVLRGKDDHSPQAGQQSAAAAPALGGKKRAKRRREKEGCTAELAVSLCALLEEHGGLAHADTLCECIAQNAGKAVSPELKAAVLMTLSTGRETFSRLNAPLDTQDIFVLCKYSPAYCAADVQGQDLEPLLPAPRMAGQTQCEADARWESLPGAIVCAIDEMEGLAHVDDICDFVLENWSKPTAELPDETLRALVEVTLRTNSMFVESPGSPMFWRVDPAHWSLHVSRAAHLRNLAERRARPAAAASADSTSPPSAGAPQDTRRSKRLVGAADRNGKSKKVPGSKPGAGEKDGGNGGGKGASVRQLLAVACAQCTSTIPSRGPFARWKKGSKGEALCMSCAARLVKKHACPVCGKMYNQGDADDDDSAWIQCDDCKRWVMTSCDDEIEDLSLYDDSNPNHLHYSCPICRQERADPGSTAASAAATGGIGAGGSAAAAAAATADSDEPARKKQHREEEAIPDAETALAALSERMDSVVDELVRDGADAEDMRAHKANLMKRCEGTIRRSQREYERNVERVKREVRKERAELEDDVVRHLRDHASKQQSGTAPSLFRL